MERLTKKVDGVWTALCKYGNSPYPIVTQEIIDRLAVYEDTGLAPEEVQAMRWIPVEERLPGDSDGLVIMTDGEIVHPSYGNAMFGFDGKLGVFAPTKRKPWGFMRVTQCLYRKRQRR